MKKLISLAGLLVFTATVASAISLQVRPVVGYGLGINKDQMGTELVVDSSGNTTKDENIYYSGATGINMGASVITSLKENIDLELGFGYVMGNEKEVSIMENNSVPLNGYTITTKLQTTIIPVDLTARISQKIGDLKPYVGFGPSIPLGGKTIVTTDEENASVFGYDTSEEEAELTYQTNLGWNAKLGTDYKLKENISFFAELMLRSLTVKKDKMVVTKYTEDGDDQLDNLTTRDKETVYKEDSSDDDSSDTSSPEISNTSDSPAGSLSINAGVSIKF